MATHQHRGGRSTAVRGLGGLLATYGNTFRIVEYFVVVLSLAAIGVVVAEGCVTPNSASDWMCGTDDSANFEPMPLQNWVDFGPLDAVLADLDTDESMDPADR